MDELMIGLDSRGKVILDKSDIVWKENKEYQDIFRLNISNGCMNSWLSVDDLYYGCKYLNIEKTSIECMCESVERKIVSQAVYNEGKKYVSKLSSEITDDISMHANTNFSILGEGTSSIIEALNYSPVNDREFTVFKNVSNFGIDNISKLSDLKPGDEFTDLEYFSTSWKPSYVSGKEGCCIFMFNIRKGMKVLFIEEIGFLKETEVLTYPGLVFLITSMIDKTIYDYTLKRSVSVRLITADVL
uniref:ADP-ribosyltransferase exoenzyme n=1 Tax=Pithovirus LCPAC403 TaxID=2506596 RepID=A0A481ZAW8_9VIRU|nr:MAG: hypothetical protein LCPAC403_02020 [Pithovirus LCPAC403]